MINTYKKGKGWIKHSEAYTEDELKKIYDIGHPKIAPYLNLAPLKTLPSSYTIPLSTQIPVNDQGQYGCCTGEAAVGMMQCFDLINDGAFTKLSPLFNYWFSRYILNGKVPTSDDGSTILAAMQALVNYGNAPELDWPITSPLEGKPSTKAQTDAKAYNVLKYFTIPESTVSDPTKNTEILSLKQLLYSNSPVMFGCDVHDSIMNVGSDGLEPYAPENSKTDPIDGAHVIFSSLIELGNIVRNQMPLWLLF